MNYITILEVGASCCPNVGTIAVTKGLTPIERLVVDNWFKEAIESHFDAALMSYEFVDDHVEDFADCINARPIEVLVKIEGDGCESEHLVELSQTWLYG